MADTAITPGSGEMFFGLDSRRRRPPAGSLTTEGAAPVVSVGTFVQSQVGASLAIVGFAATLVLGTVITPGGAALGFEGGAPVQDHGIAPTAGALDLSGSPPTLLTDARITPGAGALTATGAAPTLEVPGDTPRTPLAGSLALTGAAPTLLTDSRAAPQPGALAFAGAAPSLVEDARLTPQAGAADLAGGTPTLARGAIAEPSAGALAFAGGTPGLVQDVRLIPAAGALSLTGAPPTLEVPGDTSRTPGAGELSLTGATPGLLTDTRATPQAGALALVGDAPGLVEGIRLTPAGGAADLAGASPALVQGAVAEPSAGMLSFVGQAPSTVEDTRLTPASGALAFTGGAPTLPQEGIITPGAGNLVAEGAAPILLQASLITPSAGALELSGASPGVAQGPVITPAAGALVLSGAAPELLHDARITPSAGGLVATGAAGSVQVSGGTTITPAAGALALTGAAPTLELRTYFDFTRLSIRATLDAPAAVWDLDTPDISLMTGDDPATTIRLAAGFVDGSGVAQLVNQIEAGRVTGRSWAGARPGLSVRLRGLDAMDTLMRTQRAIRYVPAPPPAVLEAVAPAEGEPEVEVKVGTWTARSIATDLLAGTGLGLYWGVRDYTFHEEFAGVGSILALLRQLVAPWDIAPLGVDIRAQASVIRVTQRQLSPAATVSKSMAAGRFDAVQGERRQHPLIGAVVLEGRLESSRLTETVDEDGGIIWVGGDDEDNPAVSRQPLTVRTSRDTRDAFDRIISRTEREERWRMPDRLLEFSREKVWQANAATGGTLQQASETEITITLDASVYGPRGPINQPLPRSSVKVVSTLVPQVSGVIGVGGTLMALKLTSREESGYTYDAQRFLREQTTKVFTYSYDVAGAVTIKESEKVTTTWKDELPGWIRVTDVRETFDAAGQPSGSSTQDRIAAGYPPGGPRQPGQNIFIFILDGDTASQDALDAADLTPIRLTATISADPTAIPVRLSNRNLSAADLAYQFTLLQAASGVYERPFRFSGPAMPWLSVGDVLEVTAYTPYVGAAPTSLGPGLVRELAMTYTRATAELRAEGEALVYEAA